MQLSMSRSDLNELDRWERFPGTAPQKPEIIVAEVVPEPSQRTRVPVIRRRRVLTPVLLFVATCASTLLVGGWMYALPVMTILLCHETGHFLQARRYGVYATYPYFLPMPISPIGTFGAVIAMGARMGDRRALFDIGITGPLAGLVPTLLFCVVGLQLSEWAPASQHAGELGLGAPLLFQQLATWIMEPPSAGNTTLALHPVAFAGWVGLLITAINLIPIGQLDGGHVLYGLLRQKAHSVAWLLLLGAGVAIVLSGLYGWLLMLLLLMLIGPAHPPTANDNAPLGFGRIVLGWLTLAFIPLGFTPEPFLIT